MTLFEDYTPRSRWRLERMQESLRGRPTAATHAFTWLVSPRRPNSSTLRTNCRASTGCPSTAGTEAENTGSTRSKAYDELIRRDEEAHEDREHLAACKNLGEGRALTIVD